MGRVVLANYAKRYIMIDLPRGRGAIHEGTAEGFERILKKMNCNGHDPIHFFIHGHDGGDFYACLKMAQAIEGSASPIITVPFIRVRSGAFWLTQTGCGCLAVPGTHFLFHHATDFFMGKKIRNCNLSQRDYVHRIDELKRIDAMQLLFFTRRGRPIKRIFDLFGREANLTVHHARSLHLVQGVFDPKEFGQIRATLYAMPV